MYQDFLYPELNRQAHWEDKEILVSIGGWGNSYGFSEMAADSVSRMNFKQNIVDFCFDHDYDGVNIDWEYPESVADRNNLTLLVSEIRQAFNEEDSGMIITMAVSAGSWFGQWFDYTALKEYVDYFECMSYDFHGSWTDHSGHNSPLYAPATDPEGSVDTGFNYLHNTRGIPKDQLLIGMPFYGREFNSSQLYGPSSGSENEYGYGEIQPMIGNGWDYFWDDFSKVPYLINSEQTKLISYDDTMSIRLKCEYAIEKDVAGVMIWALGHDLIGNDTPLLETVGKKMKSVTRLQSNAIDHSLSSILHNNYPNPFNTVTMINYQLFTNSDVELSVYNLLGQKVATLVNEFKPAGQHQVQWDASGFSSGVYAYRLMTEDGFSDTKKLLLLK
jgi:chitinase